eukprot:scpid85335/ scgid6039/ 
MLIGKSLKLVFLIGCIRCGCNEDFAAISIWPCVVTNDCEQGEEVYNTYGPTGLHDSDLLRLYGFTIGPPLDCKPCAAYLPVRLCKEYFSQNRCISREMLSKCWNFLCDGGVDDESETGGLGMITYKDGSCRLDEALQLTIKVLVSTWKDESTFEVDDNALNARESKKILTWACSEQLKSYAWSYTECEEQLKAANSASRGSIDRRRLSAVRACWEQMFVLRHLQKAKHIRCQ